MIPNKKETRQNPDTLRNAADSYTLHLTEGPYRLTQKDLLEQVDDRLPLKRHWTFYDLRVISFKDHVLKVELLHLKEPHVMTIRIESDKLHVSCSCGTAVKTLCLHAFKSLEWIAVRKRKNYLEKYRADGLAELGIRHKKYFEKSAAGEDLDFIPHLNLGSVYKIAEKVSLPGMTHMLDLPDTTSAPAKTNETTLSYLVMDSFLPRHPTFLLPCVGLLKKSGEGIKRFGRFISGTERDYDSYLTDDQRTLNKLCYEMWQQANHQNGKLLEPMPGQTGTPEDLFSLWEQALPLLHHQPYVYDSLLYHMRELKRQPQKKGVRRITISKRRPKLSFQLIEKEDFYQLSLKATINGKVIHKLRPFGTFFVEKDNELYLLASLRDAGAAEWMGGAENCITIFKEHYKSFELELLNPLRKCYPVELKNRRN